MRMPFGRHKGEPLDTLPGDYFDWLLTIDLKEPLKSAIELEQQRRLVEVSAEVTPLAIKTTARQIISSGYRQLALKYHPDHGGAHAVMVLVNRAKEFLEERLQ